MRRGHRGGRRGRGRGHARPQSRFGGFNPVKALAVVAGIAVGGVVAAGLVGLLMLVLAMIGIATAGLSWLLTYGWTIAAFLIYRAIRSRQAEKQQPQVEPPPFINEPTWQDEQLEQEYRQRAEQVHTRTGDTAGSQDRWRRIGTSAVAILCGFGLALGANLGLQALSLSSLANTLLPPLVGAGTGLGVYAALRRWVFPPIDAWEPATHEVKKQVGRITRKARELSREASDAGGVFNGLDDQAGRLADEASALADRLYELRRIAEDVRQKMDEAHDAETVGAASSTEMSSDSGQTPDPRVRLDELLTRNHAAQQRCLSQIARIEDLLDVARLEVACPDESPEPDPTREELVQEVETELEAARRALAEVRSQSQTV